MNQTADGALAASILAENQYGGIARGQRSSLSAKAAHDRASPNEIALAIDSFDVVARDVRVQIVIAREKVPPYDSLKCRVVHWPEQAVSGSEANRFLLLGRVIRFTN